MTGKHAHPPQPADIVRTALAEPVACPSCGSAKPCRCVPQAAARLDTMAQRIVERLTGAGLLHAEPEPPREATQTDVDEAARWLAGQTRHPRYSGDDGWRRVLESEVNIEHAYAAAVRAANPITTQHSTNLAAAKALLLGWLGAAKRRADEK